MAVTVDVTDQAGFVHALIYDGVSVFGTENLAHTFEPRAREAVTRTLLAGIAESPASGQWSGFQWMKL